MLNPEQEHICLMIKHRKSGKDIDSFSTLFFSCIGLLLNVKRNT